MKQENFSLTIPQQSIWLVEQFYENMPINNVVGRILIKEEIDFKKLKIAINLFIKECETFRLKFFINEKNEVKQYISDFEEVNIKNVFLNNKTELEVLEQNVASDPFKILKNLLFEFTIFRFEDNSGGFIIKTHHLIADAFTGGIVTSKIIEIYSKLLKDDNYKSDLNLYSYKDYIISNNEYLKSERYKKDQEYWESNFKTIPNSARIPFDISDTNFSTVAKRKQFNITKEKTDMISQYCKKNKVSSFNFFMAVFAVYFSKINNLQKLTIGTPVLNRTTVKEKFTPGMFINTVPFVFDLQNSIEFENFARGINQTALSVFRHQKYPYQKTLEYVRKNIPNQPNLYDILISYQNAKTNTNTSEVKFDLKWLFTGQVSDSINIHVFDLNDTGILNIAYDYQICKYSEEDIVNTHKRIEYLIDQIIYSDVSNIEKLEIVTIEEKKELVFDFNNTYLEYDKNVTLIQHFENQVLKTPNNIALVFEKQSLTYKQLNEKVNCLAKYLIDKKVQNNEIIGVVCDRSFEMIISILAVLKAGCAYIPIDPDYPNERLNYMFAQSNTSTILTLKALENKVKELSHIKNIIFVDLSNLEIYENADNFENLNLNVSAENLSYLIYTSGSTGEPKGVMLTQKNLSNFYNSMINKIEYLKDRKKSFYCFNNNSFV